MCGCGDSALKSSSQCIEDCETRGQRMQLDVLYQEIGAHWRQSRIPKWRATADEDGTTRSRAPGHIQRPAVSILWRRAGNGASQLRAWIISRDQFCGSMSHIQTSQLQWRNTCHGPKNYSVRWQLLFFSLRLELASKVAMLRKCPQSQPLDNTEVLRSPRRRHIRRI